MKIIMQVIRIITFSVVVVFLTILLSKKLVIIPDTTRDEWEDGEVTDVIDDGHFHPSSD